PWPRALASPRASSGSEGAQPQDAGLPRLRQVNGARARRVAQAAWPRRRDQSPAFHLDPAARRWRNRPGVLAIRAVAVLRASRRDLSRLSASHRRMSRGEISIVTVRPGSISLSIASKAAWNLQRKASWAGASTFHCSADIVLGAPVRRTSVGLVLISQACGTPSFTP